MGAKTPASTKYDPRVSVIINTCDRGPFIGDTLEGLLQQTYKNFEVVLVNGPSTDNTEEIAKSYNVRYYTAPYNISVSRNVGIKNAAGEILAFIDDDAVPEPRWLEDIVKGYQDNPEAGAVGGFVYNADGSDFQFCYGSIDKWGYPRTRTEAPYEFNEPHGHSYNINIGTNASYRREPLIEVGGFDEEIEYYHDESDVCVRLINNGYEVVQLDKAFVHHKMAPSSRRDGKKRVTNWDAIVKNSIYFGVKHSKGLAPVYKRIFKFIPIESRKFVGMFTLFIRGQYNPWEYLVRNVSLVRAFWRGYYRGFFQEQKLLTDYNYRPNEFKKFITKEFKNVKNIVLVTQGYPPAHTDGIARYNHTLAKSLTELGHRVFVVTKSDSNQKQIFFRDKHWVYFHNEKIEFETSGFGRLDRSIELNKGSYKTVKELSEKIHLDVVTCPLWDVEGLYLMKEKIAPTILTLMSPLKKVVETQWYWVKDPSIETVYELEKYCIERADAIMSISGAVKDTIGEAYSIKWNDLGKPVVVLPLGVEFAIEENVPKNENSNVKLLYVGRAERRKGIDLLLDVLPSLMSKNDNLEVDLVGNFDVENEDGKYYYKEFLKKNHDADWLSRVHQFGYVTEEELENKYRECDLFVAPSRYESFGLIFIEAMSKGKPVVGTNVGGIPEIIKDGANGFLFENEDKNDLEKQLQKLISDEKLRHSMGKKGIEILRSKFDPQDMAQNFIDLADKISVGK